MKNKKGHVILGLDYLHMHTTMKYLPFLLVMTIAGCMMAKVAGTGVNVQDATHLVSVQANSFNGEVSINGSK